MRHNPTICTCGSVEMCECVCEKCLARNSARVHSEDKYQRLSDLLHRFEKAGISVEDLGELVWMARGQYIEAEIAKRVEQAVKATFARLKISVDWKEP